MIGDYETSIRNYDAHGPRDNPADLEKRLGNLSDLLSQLDEERGILDATCSSDADKAPLFAQIGAAEAWALALESDIAIKLNASCPPAAKALPQAMLAQAWLTIAATVNDAGGTVPKSIAEVVPKIQARAPAVGLILPPYGETSVYWRDQISNAAKATVQACPHRAATPTPAPTPTSTWTPPPAE
jgi:hypothetical protein